MAIAPGFPGGFPQPGSLFSITAGGGVSRGGVGAPIPLTSLGGLSMMAGADVSPFDPRSGLPTRPARTFAEAAQFSFQQNQFVNRLAQRARAQAEATIQQALGLVQRGGPGSLAVLTSPLFTQLANIRGQATFQPFDFTAGLQQPVPFLGGGGVSGVRNLAAARRRGEFQQPSPFGFQDFGGQFQDLGAPQQITDLFFRSAEQADTAGGAFQQQAQFPTAFELRQPLFDPTQAQDGFQPAPQPAVLPSTQGGFPSPSSPSDFFRFPVEFPPPGEFFGPIDTGPQAEPAGLPFPGDPGFAELERESLRGIEPGSTLFDIF